MMRRRTWTVALAGLVLVAVAATARADGYSTKQNKEDEYRVGVKFLPEVEAGDRTTARLWIVACSGWKVNEKYPTKVVVTAPGGVSLPEDTFDADDALSMDSKKAVFRVGYTPESSGKHTMKAKVKMSVCKGKEECIVRTENLSWTVTATEGSGG